MNELDADLAERLREAAVMDALEDLRVRLYDLRDPAQAGSAMMRSDYAKGLMEGQTIAYDQALNMVVEKIKAVWS